MILSTILYIALLFLWNSYSQPKIAEQVQKYQIHKWTPLLILSALVQYTVTAIGFYVCIKYATKLGINLFVAALLFAAIVYIPYNYKNHIMFVDYDKYIVAKEIIAAILITMAATAFYKITN